MTSTAAAPPKEPITTALRTVAVNGAYTASRALSKWLRRGVRLTSNGFERVAIKDASRAFGAPDDVIAAIYLPLVGDLTGHMLLTFPEDVACALADMILQAPEGTTTSLGEIERSCLEETGNIVCSAYANSLAKWLKLHIEPAAPTFAWDMVESIVQPLLTDAATDQDEVYVARTEFRLDERKLEWGMMLLPSPGSLETMEQKCHEDGIRSNALRTIAVNGAFTASRAVSKWLRRGVKISTEGLVQTPLAEVAEQFDADTPIVALRMPLGEQLHGHALVAIKHEHALALVDMLLGQPKGTTTEIGDLERSALEETGNIIASSFVNSWSTWLDVHIEPAPPEFAFDFPAAIIEGVVAEQALVSDDVFLARTEFIVDGESLEWVFLLLPAPSAMRLIETSCQ